MSGANLENLRGLKVLVVDDDPDLREIISEYFEMAFASVLRAESGEAALKVFSANEPVDLIVSDSRMPGIGGLGLLKSLRENSSSLPPFILVSGNADDGIGTPDELRGLSSVVQKPFDFDTLLAEAVRVIALKRETSPAS